MRKFYTIIIFICIFVQILYINIVYADDYIDENYEKNNIVNDLEDVSIEPTKIPTLNSRAAVIFDRTSKTILYGKEENNKRPMASTTKIMTAIVVLENANLSDTVKVSKRAADTGGSRLGLKTGDKITVNNLLYGLMLCSGNDAAVALAEHVGGSIEGFTELMNKKAEQLNLINTSFVTPHGLDADEHYTTAYELAKIADYALNIKEFLGIVGTQNYTVYINGRQKNLTNTNELLGNLNGVYGVKTGFTNGANRCLVTATKRGDMDIICVVLGADTKKNRTQDSAKLIEYAFASFEMVDIKKIVEEEFDELKKCNQTEVVKGEKKVVEYTCDYSNISKYPIFKEELKNINVQIDITSQIVAPVYSNDVVGELKVLVNNKEILKEKIVANESIDKKGIYSYFKEFISGYNMYINEAIKQE